MAAPPAPAAVGRQPKKDVATTSGCVAGTTTGASAPAMAQLAWMGGGGPDMRCSAAAASRESTEIPLFRHKEAHAQPHATANARIRVSFAMSEDQSFVRNEFTVGYFGDALPASWARRDASPCPCACSMRSASAGRAYMAHPSARAPVQPPTQPPSMVEARFEKTCLTRN